MRSLPDMRRNIDGRERRQQKMPPLPHHWRPFQTFPARHTVGNDNPLIFSPLCFLGVCDLHNFGIHGVFHLVLFGYLQFGTAATSHTGASTTGNHIIGRVMRRRFYLTGMTQETQPGPLHGVTVTCIHKMQAICSFLLLPFPLVSRFTLRKILHDAYLVSRFSFLVFLLFPLAVSIQDGQYRLRRHLQSTGLHF